MIQYLAIRDIDVKAANPDVVKMTQDVWGRCFKFPKCRKKEEEKWAAISIIIRQRENINGIFEIW